MKTISKIKICKKNQVRQNSAGRKTIVLAEVTVPMRGSHSDCTERGEVTLRGDCSRPSTLTATDPDTYYMNSCSCILYTFIT